MSPDVKSIYVENKEEWDWVYKTAYSYGYTWMDGQKESLFDTYSDTYNYIILRKHGKTITVSTEPKGDSESYNCRGLLQLFVHDLDEDEQNEKRASASSKPAKEKELIVFTTSGNTYDFKGVTNFSHTTTGFSFSYTGVSTGVTRFAEFDYKSTAGYALSDMKE